MKHKKVIKKAAPWLIISLLLGSAATWYVVGREKRQKETRDIDFQKVTV